MEAPDSLRLAELHSLAQQAKALNIPPNNQTAGDQSNTTSDNKNEGSDQPVVGSTSDEIREQQADKDTQALAFEGEKFLEASAASTEPKQNSDNLSLTATVQEKNNSLCATPQPVKTDKSEMPLTTTAIGTTTSNAMQTVVPQNTDVQTSILSGLTHSHDSTHPGDSKHETALPNGRENLQTSSSGTLTPWPTLEGESDSDDDSNQSDNKENLQDVLDKALLELQEAKLALQEAILQSKMSSLMSDSTASNSAVQQHFETPYPSTFGASSSKASYQLNSQLSLSSHHAPSQSILSRIAYIFPIAVVLFDMALWARNKLMNNKILQGQNATKAIYAVNVVAGLTFAYESYRNRKSKSEQAPVSQAKTPQTRPKK